MSRAQQARDWLGAQDGPRTSREVANAVGGDPVKIQWAVGCMLRDGLIARVFMGRPATYVLARDAMPHADRVAAASAGRQAWIGRTRSSREEARRVREAAKQVIANQRRVELRVSVDAARRKRDKVNRGVALNILARIRPASTELPRRPAIKPQTVDDFIAQGGMIQRFQPGERSGAGLLW